MEAIPPPTQPTNRKRFLILLVDPGVPMISQALAIAQLMEARPPVVIHQRDLDPILMDQDLQLDPIPFPPINPEVLSIPLPEPDPLQLLMDLMALERPPRAKPDLIFQLDQAMAFPADLKRLLTQPRIRIHCPKTIRIPKPWLIRLKRKKNWMKKPSGRSGSAKTRTMN